MPISPPNSAVNTHVGRYRKGADLIIARVPLFSVSPNTAIKKNGRKQSPHAEPIYGERAE